MTRDGGVIRFQKRSIRIVGFPHREQENGFLEVFW